MNLRSNHAPSSSANVPRPICTPLRLQVYLIVVHLVADIVRLTPGTTRLLPKEIVFDSIFAKSYSFLLRISILRFLSVPTFFHCSPSGDTDI